MDLDVRLGKKEYIPDPLTLRIARFLTTEIPAPPNHDFDSGRRPFRYDVYGNDAWGNCVIVARGNQLVRVERVEQRRTLPLRTEHCVEEYKKESEREFGGRPETPGDAHDQGLYYIEAMKAWRNIGWDLDFNKSERVKSRNYKIAAYGEITPQNEAQLRRAIYLLHGVQLGFNLPVSAASQTRQGYWDVVEGPNSAPGSWGGHAVYAKRYTPDSIYVITWGKEIRVSNAFVEKYCDEAWAVVDNFDDWRKSRTIDVDALIQKLRDIGASGIQ